ncbi:D-glycero-alpha-D-manno-heptose 7-phosphate kinase (EC [Olavius algarvensis associated proteobacterium Delta 3]|nr:D-glycero-alpha-D-manno-heptose 7-phosphate kinase (EC [Olavius algarvensis associated proteobacterium Delta 3]CAB5139537.1 D-glycero-alpha-D-manno-heptose 7-phosphate kinase (EC [Olavius algarvensis associated proteobacterium Delta 3]
MIISRTPFRLSFFGGGTDYPEWYLKHGGCVLSTSINKYCYISLRYLPPFFEHRIRLVYSNIELCRHYSEIEHPAVRETLRFLNLDRGLEIHHDGDLPARSGMGSSSSFTVGMLHACYALQGKMVSKHRLATESIHVEQDMIQETVGSQDQFAAAYGGINHILFKTNGEIELRHLTLTTHRCEELNAHLMLFYTGIKRTASNVADSYVHDINEKEKQLFRMHTMVDTGIDILQSNDDILRFGELLHEAWTVKRSLSTTVSNHIVDDMYERARSSGAIGGKITGAGGGGFLLLFVPPEKQALVRRALGELLHVPFRFDYSGTQVIVYEPHLDEYNLAAEQDRDGRTICQFRELDQLIE